MDMAVVTLIIDKRELNAAIPLYDDAKYYDKCVKRMIRSSIDLMTYKYTANNEFYWSFTGFTTQAMAVAAAEEMEASFKKAYDASEWESGSSAIHTAKGYKAEFWAKRNVQVPEPVPVPADG